MKDSQDWAEYLKLVKKQRVINQVKPGPSEDQFDLSFLLTMGEIKSEPIWELDKPNQNEPNKQCGRNPVQPESISGTGQDSINVEVVQDQLVQLDEIVHIDDVDDTDTDVQSDQKIGYIVDKLNPDDTIEEDPPQELVAECRVLLFKHLPPAWNKTKIREFVIANTSAVSKVTKYYVLAPPKAHSTHDFILSKSGTS